MAQRRRARRPQRRPKTVAALDTRLTNQQRHASTPHNAGIAIDPESIMRQRIEHGLEPLPALVRLPKSATPEQREAAHEQMAREIDVVADLFSRGHNEHEIRAMTGFTKKQLEFRVRKMRKAALDAPLAWMKFLTGAQQDLKRLYYVFAKAMQGDKPRFGIALDAIAKMHDVRCSIIEQGQECGVYDRKPDDFGVGIQELTLALLVGTQSRGGLTGLPSGNLHKTPPSDLTQLPPLVRDALGDDVEDGELADDEPGEEPETSAA